MTLHKDDTAKVTKGDSNPTAQDLHRPSDISESCGSQMVFLPSVLL